MVTYLKKDRQALIVKQTNVHSRVTYNDLAQLLNVSEDTIRRDLNELAAKNKLVKIKGGAMAVGNRALEVSGHSYAFESKEIIARKALKLLKEGMLVIVGGGTTIREFIRQIPNNLRATFLTLNPHTCIELLEKPNIETIMIGGKVSNYSQSVVGGDAFLKLSQLQADLCFIGTNAIDAKEGLTDSDWDSVEIKKAIFNSSKKIAVLSISEKINTAMNLKVCDISKIDYLVTELPADSPDLENFRSAGVTVL